MYKLGQRRTTCNDSLSNRSLFPDFDQLPLTFQTPTMSNFLENTFHSRTTTVLEHFPQPPTYNTNMCPLFVDQAVASFTFRYLVAFPVICKGFFAFRSHLPRPVTAEIRRKLDEKLDHFKCVVLDLRVVNSRRKQRDESWMNYRNEVFDLVKAWVRACAFV